MSPMTGMCQREVISQKSEGLVSYESLLFIPSKKPMDWLYDRGNGGLQLL